MQCYAGKRWHQLPQPGLLLGVTHTSRGALGEVLSCITADAASVVFGLASGISLCMLPADGTRDALIATRRLRSAQAQDAVSDAAPGATELDHSHGITEAGDQAGASESQQQPGRSAYDEALEQVWACTALPAVLLLQLLC